MKLTINKTITRILSCLVLGAGLMLGSQAAFAQPTKSFLKQYDLSGKTIIPFNTNGGYGIGSTFETVSQLCPDSKILEGYSTRGGLERDGQLLMIKDEKARQTQDEIKEWLRKLKMI